MYLLSQLVGEGGLVVGVDMTPEQLEVARRYEDWHRNKFRYAKSNVRFLQGYIERLGDLGLEEASFDVVISNCVINLSPDKEAVLHQAYRLLKEGGEIYFSDVYSDRRVSRELREDKVLWGECLSGALYWNDFLHIARKVGFLDPRLVACSPIEITNPEIKAKVGHIKFFRYLPTSLRPTVISLSATYRLWKLPMLEPDCEDYGQVTVFRFACNLNTTP